jgi:hypothetical protein
MFYVCTVSTMMGYGGAAYVTGGTVELMRLCGDSCTAANGMFLYVSTQPAVPVIHDVTLSSSYAGVELGVVGGLYFYGGWNTEMSAQVVTINFSRPSTTSGGAACALVGSGTPTVQWCTVKGGTGWDVLRSTNYVSTLRVLFSNFVNTEQRDGIIFLSVTGSLAWVEGCHFVNVSDNHYFDQVSNGGFVVINCWFDGVFPQAGVSYSSTSGNHGQTSATTLRIQPYSNPSCPPAMRPSPTAGLSASATAVVRPATPTSNGWVPTVSSPATASAVPVGPQTPSASAGSVVTASATPASSGAAKKNEHTAPIIFGTIGGVLVVVIIVVAVLVIRRRGLFQARHYGGIEEGLARHESLATVAGGHGSRSTAMGGPLSGDIFGDSPFNDPFAAP